jgi:hypothetical protein
MRKALLAVGFIVAAMVGSGFDLARAEDCPNHPDALGTSRVLTVDPGQYPRVGAMDQAAALPLSDKEVVLTFDDGPVPRYSNQILDILAAKCVLAPSTPCARLTSAIAQQAQQMCGVLPDQGRKEPSRRMRRQACGILQSVWP